MKKVIFLVTIFCSLFLIAQKNTGDILNSTNIQEIEAYLKTANPGDSRVFTLKSKLHTLKTSAWMKPGLTPYQITEQKASEVVQPKLASNNKSSWMKPGLKPYQDAEGKTAEGSQIAEKPVAKTTEEVVQPIANNSFKSEEKVVLLTNLSDNQSTLTPLKKMNLEKPKKEVVQPKLASNNKSSWMKPGLKPYQDAEGKTAEVSSTYINRWSADEAEEFKKLILENPAKHQDKTVKLLNQLFDNDEKGKDAIIMIQNKSNCNMIVRIMGIDHYNLAIPAHGENFLVIKKGNYKLSSNMCEEKYFASKNIVKNILITLRNPKISAPGVRTFAIENSGASN